MTNARVLGLAGWSGSGKTTLLVRLIPMLVSRGLTIATIKRAHHEFDVDTPGKDSYEHRHAGAGEVIVSSGRRWVQMHELRDEPEPSLAMLLRRISPCDLILVEGFKRERHPKLEVYRQSIGKPPLFPDDPRVIAVASDVAPPPSSPPWVDLNDVQAVANCVIQSAESLASVLGLLEAA